jgi:hypothetical protein
MTIEYIIFVVINIILGSLSVTIIGCINPSTSRSWPSLSQWKVEQIKIAYICYTPCALSCLKCNFVLSIPTRYYRTNTSMLLIVNCVVFLVLVVSCHQHKLVHIYVKMFLYSNRYKSTSIL